MVNQVAYELAHKDMINQAGVGICRFGWLHKDGYYNGKYGPCHAGMDENPYKKELEAVVTSLWTYKPQYNWDNVAAMDVGKAELFWQWLIHGEDSLYRKVTANAEIFKDKDGKMKAVLIKDGINRNASELVNFMIASRLPREHFKNVNTWTDLVDSGFTGLEALYLQHFFNRGANQKVHAVRMMGGHYPFNPYPSFAKFKEAGPEVVKKPYWQSTNYMPCNSIWDGGIQNFYEVIKEPNKKYQYTGSFIKMYEAVANDNKYLDEVDPDYNRLVSTIKERKELIFV